MLVFTLTKAASARNVSVSTHGRRGLINKIFYVEAPITLLYGYQKMYPSRIRFLFLQMIPFSHNSLERGIHFNYSF